MAAAPRVKPVDALKRTDAGVLPVVLAAGLGTRMKSRRPKVLHELCGRPMLAYVLDVARRVGGRRPLVVYSPATAALTEVFAQDADFALQAEPLGTADAVAAALGAVPAEIDEILVLSGDVPLVQPELLADLIEIRRARNAALALVSVHTDQAGGLGRVVRTDDGGQVLRIVEHKDATPAELSIKEINAGIYALDAAWLRGRIRDVRPSPVSGELYLPELVGLAREDRRPVVSLEVEDDGTLAGINDRAQLAAAERELRRSINEGHMRAGVTMVDPANTYVDSTVELAADVFLEPGVILRGATRVGEGTRIGAGSQIVDTVIGRDCLVWASILERSEVEDQVQIGPFSHLRPGASIGRRAKLGNFAEVKASRLEEGVQQHHFSYIGDAQVGEKTNVGAGTVTCNYDGVRKHKTRIGKGVFLGSDTMLVAPVELGDGARTGAGSVVTKDVPAGMLALGVPARLRKPRAEAAASTADGSAATALGEVSRAHPAMSDVVLQLLVVLILVLVEAVFVAAEIALVTLRHSRIDQLIEEGHRNARRVKRLVDDPARFLAVAQIGVTFVGFLASAYAAVNLAERLAGAIAQVDALRSCLRRSGRSDRHDAARGLHHRLRGAGAQDARPRLSGPRGSDPRRSAGPRGPRLRPVGKPSDVAYPHDRGRLWSRRDQARPRSTPRSSSSSSSEEGRPASSRPRRSR